MTLKKLMCAILSSLILLSCMTACGTSEENNTDTETAGATEAVSEAETQDPRYICDLPNDLNYNDATVNFIYADMDGRKDELYSEGLDHGLISDTVYERNNIVENTLKVKFNLIPNSSDTVADVVNTDIASNTCEFDIVVNGTYRSITPAMKGQYLNINRVENIDTSKYYWTQGYNDIVTFTENDYQCLASGPLAISMFRFVFFTLFNRQMTEDRQMPDLYDLVNNGEWTLDKQISLIDGLYEDKDGDGKKSKGDFFGFATGSASSIDPYFVSSDIHLITKDVDTKELMYNDDALAPISDLADKVQLLYYNPYTWVYKGAGEDWVTKTDNIIRHFTDFRAVMVTCLFYDMESKIQDLTSMSYGLVPMPKYDTAQKDYHSYVQDQVSCFGISAGVNDESKQAMCGAVLELLAAESYRMIRPAYYDSVLSLRFMQDPASKEMLDIIFNTIDFDFCSTCRFIFPVELTLREIVTENGSRAASVTKRWKSSVEKKLKEYNADLEKRFGS